MEFFEKRESGRDEFDLTPVQVHADEDEDFEALIDEAFGGAGGPEWGVERDESVEGEVESVEVSELFKQVEDLVPFV